jgi:hypothetical protein
MNFSKPSYRWCPAAWLGLSVGSSPRDPDYHGTSVEEVHGPAHVHALNEAAIADCEEENGA